MTKNEWSALIPLLVLTLLAVGFSIGSVLAQKAERGAQSWFLGGTDNNVKIIDTSGVCLYVVLGNYDGAPAIAAVPKTQLPQGAGCQ